MDRVVEGWFNMQVFYSAIFKLINDYFYPQVICGFCLLSLLMIGVFVYYLHRKNRKMATGNNILQYQ